MCKYCNCSRPTDNGCIGERIGGRDCPMFIKRYDDAEADFLDGRYWLVKGVSYSVSTHRYVLGDYKLRREVAINFCPVCGRKFEDNYI